MRTLTTVLFLMFAAAVYAQKLPNVQQVSLRAPANVRVDGKADEWGFKAFNKATGLYYTIANSYKKLYLIFKANDQAVINRIMAGGITVLLQQPGNKINDGGISINYPYREKNKLIIFSFHRRGELPPPKELANQIADSTMKANNKKLTQYTKWIYTKGIPNIDTLLSVYNDQGIEAAQAFDIEKAYVCEIAIDIQHLGLSGLKKAKFFYQISVNDGPNKYTGMTWGATTNNGGAQRTTNEIRALQSINDTEQKLYATTDFFGEYTLAK